MFALGCGAPLENDVESDDELIFDSEAEALRSTEQCNTIAAHRTTTGEPGSFTTPGSYDPAGCTRAYLIDAFD
ncbi:hypothetical protein WME90_08165 [Sorangium sp. So ce375]|uniref:hypothetical protein n=1 Tax=Sorangium sp. So ce375 TaxID=3133306 RepID=UPI003F5C9B10